MAESIAEPENNPKLKKTFTKSFERTFKQPQKIINWYKNGMDKTKVQISKEETYQQKAENFRKNVQRR